MMVLDTGTRDLSHDHQAFGIDQQMAFASFDFLGKVKAFYAPFSVVFTD